MIGRKMYNRGWLRGLRFGRKVGAKQEYERITYQLKQEAVLNNCACGSDCAWDQGYFYAIALIEANRGKA